MYIKSKDKIGVSRSLLVAGILIGGVALSTAASALELINKNGLKLRWDNTLKYSTMYRLDDPSSKLGEVNQDDGDRNFDSGFVSNRVDWLTEMDFNYKNVGARISAAGWYDDTYSDDTDNNSFATFNAKSVPVGKFTSDARDVHEKNADLLDAFVFARFKVGGMRSILRLGQHTLMFGETLFFGANGIANAQAPVDVVKLLSVPNTQFKELLMPVNQVSGQIQINSNLAIKAYYQFEWVRSRLPAAGSYFSTLDVLDDGAERFIAGPPLAPLPGFQPANFVKAKDMNARDSGQFGVAIKWRPDNSDTDYGLYAVRYHDKTPLLYLTPSLTGPIGNPADGVIGSYQLAYAEDIESYGASMSTIIGDANVAAELSYRHNTPLVSDAQVVFGANDNTNNPAYAVGNSLHLNVSSIVAWQKSDYFDNATLTAEAGWNRRLSISKNKLALDPNTSKDAWGVRFTFEPNYYQFLPGLDVSVPLGVGYNPKGNSSVVGAFNGGVDDGGDISLGLKGTYLGELKLNLNYTHYMGSEGTTLTPVVGGYEFSFDQAFKDRDFVSFSANYTF